MINLVGAVIHASPRDHLDDKKFQGCLGLGVRQLQLMGSCGGEMPGLIENLQQGHIVGSVSPLGPLLKNKRNPLARPWQGVAIVYAGEQLLSNRMDDRNK